MSAINIVYEIGELIVRDRFLIVFQDAPSRMVTENAEIVRSASADEKAREKDKKK